MESRDKDRQYIKRSSYLETSNPYFNNTIKDYFSHQFLQDLKAEMNRKIKPSKSILEALKHSNTISQNYKKQIAELTTRIVILSKQNQDLKIKLSQLQQNANIDNHKTLLPHKRIKNHEITPLQIISLDSEQRVSEQHYEIEIIRQQLKHFQEYKVIKQQRFQEIVQRQAKLVGQISLIKYKNQTLQAKIKDLEDQITNKPTEEQKPYLTNSKSESSQKFNEYINQDDQVYVIRHLNVQKNVEQNLSNQNYNKSLMISRTQQIIIEQQYDIQRKMSNPVKHINEFNEIDALLEAEVPRIKTQDSLQNKSNIHVDNNGNASVIYIDLHSQDHINREKAKQNINSSCVFIDLNLDDQLNTKKIEQNINSTRVWVDLDAQDNKKTENIKPNNNSSRVWIDLNAYDQKDTMIII